MSDQKLNVYQRISAVMAEVGAIEKTGQNTQQGYGYVELREVKAQMQPLLVKHGLAVVPHHEILTTETVPTRSGGQLHVTTIRSTLTIVNVETPTETVVAEVIGCGSDSGDKAIYKAMSGSEKYLYGQTFCLAFGDDAEKDSHERGKAAPAPAPAGRGQAVRPAAGRAAAATAAPKKKPEARGVVGRPNDHLQFQAVIIAEEGQPVFGTSKKNGQPFTIFKAVTTDGQKLSTFDDQIGAMMIRGATIDAQMEAPNNYGERMVVAAELLGVNAEDAGSSTADELDQIPIGEDEEPF